jgi:aspartyl protease family protein
MHRILIAIIVVLAVMLLVKLGYSNSESLSADQSMRMLYYAIWGVLVGSGLLAMKRNWSESIRNLAIWGLITLVLVTAYVYRKDAGAIANRVEAGLLPGHVASVTDANGFSTVVLYKSDNGHYQADVLINQVSVHLMVDTGATTIALTYEDAQRLGLHPEGLNFAETVSTANGPALSASVTLPVVSIGGIERTNLRAGVAQQGKLDESLLGMNFLSTLSAVSFSGDQLTLKD